MKINKIDRIYESVRKIDQVYETWSTKHGFTLYEMETYYTIMKKEDRKITQKDLCLELDAPKTSINSIIKKQLREGYIEMNVNPLNKREKIIGLTERGKKVAEDLILPLFQYEKETAAMLDDDEMETAIMMHKKFADILLGKIEAGFNN